MTTLQLDSKKYVKGKNSEFNNDDMVLGGIYNGTSGNNALSTK